MRKKFSGQLDHQADTSNPLGLTPLHGVQGYLKAQMHQYSIIGRVQLLKLGKLTFSMAKLKGLSAHIKNQIA